MNKEIIHNLGITHVINVSHFIPNYFEMNEKKNETENITLQYLRIPVRDLPSVRISDYFWDANLFIDNAINVECKGHNCNNNRKQNIKNKVLVHCQRGISRSASIIIAYLMYKHKYSYEYSFKFVKERRICIEPNEGFREQLKKYEKIL